MITTLFLLIVFSAVGGFLATFVLNIVGIPGALLAGDPSQASPIKFKTGVLLSALAQSYAYLSFVAFLIGWTSLQIDSQGLSEYLVWPVAFVAVLWPVYTNLIRARVESRETGIVGAQVEALHVTTVAALVGFGLFVRKPAVAEFLWSWVPFAAQ